MSRYLIILLSLSFVGLSKAITLPCGWHPSVGVGVFCLVWWFRDGTPKTRSLWGFVLLIQCSSTPIKKIPQYATIRTKNSLVSICLSLNEVLAVNTSRSGSCYSACDTESGRSVLQECTPCLSRCHNNEPSCMQLHASSFETAHCWCWNGVLHTAWEQRSNPGMLRRNSVFLKAFYLQLFRLALFQCNMHPCLREPTHELDSKRRKRV